MFLLSEKDLMLLLDSAGVKKYKIFKNKIFGITLDFVVFIDK
jgi:hypothetical protein